MFVKVIEHPETSQNCPENVKIGTKDDMEPIFSALLFLVLFGPSCIIQRYKISTKHHKVKMGHS